MIRVLGEQLVNKIAAGEVVERPASVVKELVENSLDAGATRIEVEIASNPADYIRVTDNGSGIAGEEIPLAFTRHATSKIVGPEDLTNILTMGFRGEALPSIASVAKVKMVSSMDGGKGWLYRVEGGRVTESRPCASPRGTEIEVSDLFFNVPARRKFLKSPVTEAGHVWETVLRLALAWPGVSFTYIQNYRVVFKTPGDGLLGNVLAHVKGASYTEQFIRVKAGESYALEGLISSPEWKKKSRKEQYFFVNRRCIRSPLLMRAVDDAYRGRLLSGEYPACYIALTLPPEQLDVNVHPQKSEIRFLAEDKVYKLVAQEIRRALDQESQKAWSLKLPKDQAILPHDRQTNTSVFEPDRLRRSEIHPASPKGAYQELWSGVREHLSTYKVSDEQDEKTESILSKGYKILGQLFDSYIVMETVAGLTIVDQHAAAERIMYNRLMNNQEMWQVQELLLPPVIKMAPHQLKRVEEIKEALAQLGFFVDILGDEALVLRAAPLLARGREESILRDLIEEFSDLKIMPDRETVMGRAVASIACHTAVRANEQLERPAMEQLVKDLTSTVDYANCPHGRPTITVISRNRIEEWFKR